MAQIWRGKEASIELEQSGTTYPVGNLQEVDVTVTRNIEVLRGAGSTKRQDEMQTEMDVEVSVVFSSWDVDSWKQLIDYDSTNDNLNDTADVPTFTIKGEFTASDDTTLSFDVTGVYFEDLPISGGRDEWIDLELDGIGEDIENVTTA